MTEKDPPILCATCGHEAECHIPLDGPGRGACTAFRLPNCRGECKCERFVLRIGGRR